MENAFFFITHLTMAVCCLVIFGVGIAFNRKKASQLGMEKRSFIHAHDASDTMNEIIPAENIISKDSLQLTAN
jgi:hypothetical protein